MEERETFANVADAADDSSLTNSHCSFEDIRSDTCSEIDLPPVSSFEAALFSSDSETDDDDDDGDDTDAKRVQKEWSNSIGNRPAIIPFVGNVGLCDLPPGDLTEPHDFYSLLVTDELFEEIAKQTNLHASRVLAKRKNCAKARSHLDDWVATSKDEIKSFFGLVLWMGIINFPEVSFYWSNDPLFQQHFTHRVMCRNRFLSILRMLSFADNSETTAASNVEAFSSIEPVVRALKDNFQKYYRPPESLRILESFVSRRRGDDFERSDHRLKSDLKIVKLCSKGGYTHSFRICFPKRFDATKMSAADVVVWLSQEAKVLGKGHTIFTGDRYTSLNLAQKLAAENTHLVGKVRHRIRGLDRRIVAKRSLKRGEIAAKEHRSSGVTLMKWKDDNGLKSVALSTKHSTKIVMSKNRRGRNCTKPELFCDYDECKRRVRISERATWHNGALLKTLKCHKKLVMELLLNVAVVNAWVMYSAANHCSISVSKFREKLVTHLCDFREDESDSDDEDDKDEDAECFSL